MSARITELHPTRTNHTCGNCGSEWFDLPVVLDATTFKITGHALQVRCRDCGHEATVGERSLT